MSMKETAEIIDELRTLQQAFMDMARRHTGPEPNGVAYGAFLNAETCRMAAEELQRSVPEEAELEGDPTCCDASTAGKIIKCGSWDGYCAFKDEKARKTREKNQKAAEEEPAEEQVPGQIRMDLEPEKPEMSEQVKMMRFIAGQVDKLYMKLETINDTLSQILRVVRKE